MYSPLSVQRHLISSSILLVNCVSLMASQRSANSETYACEFGGYMWPIHLLFSRAFCTEIFFLCVFWNKLGTIVFAEASLIHDKVQNKVVFHTHPSNTRLRSLLASRFQQTQNGSLSAKVTYWRIGQTLPLGYLPLPLSMEENCNFEPKPDPRFLQGDSESSFLSWFPEGIQ